MMLNLLDHNYQLTPNMVLPDDNSYVYSRREPFQRQAFAVGTRSSARIHNEVLYPLPLQRVQHYPGWISCFDTYCINSIAMFP